MDGEIDSLILHVYGAPCPAPHKHKEYVSSGAENARPGTALGAATASGHAADFN